MSRLLRWTSTPTGRRIVIIATTVIVLMAASNPLWLPVLTMVDAVGLDVLGLLIGAQALALLPWLVDRARRWTGPARRVLAGIVAGAAGGYLRQLLFGGWMPAQAMRIRLRIETTGS